MQSVCMSLKTLNRRNMHKTEFWGLPYFNTIKSWTPCGKPYIRSLVKHPWPIKGLWIRIGIDRIQFRPETVNFLLQILNDKNLQKKVKIL